MFDEKFIRPTIFLLKLYKWFQGRRNSDLSVSLWRLFYYSIHRPVLGCSLTFVTYPSQKTATGSPKTFCKSHISFPGYDIFCVHISQCNNTYLLWYISKYSFVCVTTHTHTHNPTLLLIWIVSQCSSPLPPCFRLEIYSKSPSATLLFSSSNMSMSKSQFGNSQMQPRVRAFKFSSCIAKGKNCKSLERGL